MSAASPELDAKDTDALRASIAKLGQLVPIVMWRGKVIDGRKRLVACEALGIKPRTIEIPNEAIGSEHASALNLLRTHYSTGQRAMYAATLATLSRGQRADYAKLTAEELKSSSAVLTRQNAADLAGVHKMDVSRARTIRRDGSPEVVAAVESGALGLQSAEKIVRMLPKEKHADVVARAVTAKGQGKNMPPGTIKPIVRDSVPRTIRKPTPEVLGRIVESLTNTCEVLKPYVDQLGVCPAGQRLRWIRNLDEVLTTLRRFRRRLQVEGKP